MKKYYLFMPLMLLLVFLAGCDPSQDELKKSQNIDIRRIQGTVASKYVMYYTGDLTETMEKKGQPYYCIEITALNGSKELFRGVSEDIFDTLAEGMELPQTPLLTMQQLAKMEGRIADKIPFPEKNKFFIVVDDYATVRLYRVDMAAYYSKKVFVEAKLPLALDE